MKSFKEFIKDSGKKKSSKNLPKKVNEGALPKSQSSKKPVKVNTGIIPKSQPSKKPNK